MTQQTQTAAAQPAAKPRPTADVRADLAQLRNDKKQAEADLARLAAARPDILRTGTDSQLEKHDAEAAKAGRTIERSAARIEVLTAEFAAAERAEDQARRREVYQAAVKVRQETEATLRTEYGPAAVKLAALLATVATARQTIRNANELLPDGAARLADPEDFRGRSAKPGTPRKAPSHFDYVTADGRKVDPKTVFCLNVDAFLADNKVERIFMARAEKGSPGAELYRPPPPSFGGEYYRVRVFAQQQYQTVYDGALSFQAPSLLHQDLGELPGLLWGEPPIWKRRF